MNSTDTKYIAENFIEKKALLNHFGFDEEFFENLIREKIIPGSSYAIETVIKITSPLGDTSDEKYCEEYFAKNTLSLIEQYLKSNFTAESKKADFRSNFKKSLLHHQDRKFAYNNIFNGNTFDEQEFDKNFESEWDFYIRGGYGICTLHANEQEIVEKEILVKKLKKLYEETRERNLKQDEINELIELNEQFNKVAALFAPYQRVNSSRGKYLDRLLEKVRLTEKIKTYR
ncbi:DUF6058 family natural product biosynthesis protein [Empedobacter brevis]|uniref:DUF6058 family natural product biosynthesis protein n=1 Tax=Empedobacter brevis TaxID=247 RepID=UPI0028992B91|nr:DUF6058 family natural product biosynthesis protein [Empedobacter brevis]